MYRLRFDFETGIARLYYRHPSTPGSPVRTGSSPLFRIVPYILLGVIGFSVVVTTENAAPTAPRLSRRARLVDLIAREDERTRSLRARLEALQVQITAFETAASTGQRSLQQLRAEIDRLGRFVGVTEIVGPGVRVELRDSTMRESPTGDPNDLVIHEQDLQAVVNALWSGGAEAMAVNGERITSSSAVRCVGNTLLLHGTVHAPPYLIEALGDTGALLAGLEGDPFVQRFRIFAEEFRLGFDTKIIPELTLPAFRGLIAANHATPGA